MKRELLALVCVLIALAQAAPTLDYTNHTVELGSVFTAAFNISTANQALFRVQPNTAGGFVVCSGFTAYKVKVNVYAKLEDGAPVPEPVEPPTGETPVEPPVEAPLSPPAPFGPPLSPPAEPVGPPLSPPAEPEEPPMSSPVEPPQDLANKKVLRTQAIIVNNVDIDPITWNYSWVGTDGVGLADTTTCLYIPSLEANPGSKLLVLVTWETGMLPYNETATIYVNPESVQPAPLHAAPESLAWEQWGQLEPYQKHWFAITTESAAVPDKAQLVVEQCDYLPYQFSEDGNVKNRFRVGITILPPTWGASSTYVYKDDSCVDELGQSKQVTELGFLGNRAYTSQVCPSTFINFLPIAPADKQYLFYISLRPEQVTPAVELPTDTWVWYSVALRQQPIMTSRVISPLRVIQELVLSLSPVEGADNYTVFLKQHKPDDSPQELAMLNSACYLQRWGSKLAYTNTTVFEQTVSENTPFATRVLRLFEFYSYIKPVKEWMDKNGDTVYGYVTVLAQGPRVTGFSYAASLIPGNAVQGINLFSTAAIVVAGSLGGIVLTLAIALACVLIKMRRGDDGSGYVSINTEP